MKIRLHIVLAIALTLLTGCREDTEQEGHKFLTEAQKAAEEIKDDYDRWPALYAIASAQAASGDIVGAQATAQAINGHEWLQVRAFSDIATAQAVAGDVEGSKKTVANALKIAQNVNIDSQRDLLMDSLKGQAASGDIEGARNTLEGIKTLTIMEAFGLSWIALGQAASGDTNGAKVTIFEAHKIAERISPSSGGLPNLLGSIALAQAEFGEFEKAKATISEAQSIARSMQPDNPSSVAQQVRVFSTIALAQVAAGDIDGAKETIIEARAIAQSIDRGLPRGEAFSAIASAQAACGDIEEAKKTVESIEGLGRRAEAFAGIAKELLKTK